MDYLCGQVYVRYITLTHMVAMLYVVSDYACRHTTHIYIHTYIRAYVREHSFIIFSDFFQAWVKGLNSCLGMMDQCLDKTHNWSSFVSFSLHEYGVPYLVHTRLVVYLLCIPSSLIRLSSQLCLMLRKTLLSLCATELYRMHKDSHRVPVTRYTHRANPFIINGW